MQKGKFGEVIYIPAVSTVTEHTKISGPSALRDLLNDVLQGVVRAGPAYQRFSEEFETLHGTIKTHRARLGGRAPRGERWVVKVPQGHGHTATLIAAWGSDGIVCSTTVHAAVHGNVFEALVKPVRVPSGFRVTRW